MHTVKRKLASVFYLFENGRSWCSQISAVVYIDIIHPTSVRSHLTGLACFPFKRKTKNAKDSIEEWDLTSQLTQAGRWDDFLHINRP